MKVKCGRDRRYIPKDVLDASHYNTENGGSPNDSHVEALGMATRSSSTILRDERNNEGKKGPFVSHENPALDDTGPQPPPLVSTPPNGTPSARMNPSSTRLKRATLPVDPITETTAVQRLVEYFVVISCRQSNTACHRGPPPPQSKSHGHSRGTIRGGGTTRPLRPESREESLSSEESASHPPETNKKKWKNSTGGLASGEKAPTPQEQYCQPKITARYPLKDHRDNPLNPMILQFCFPTGEEVTPSKSYELPRIHYFTLTNDRGRKVYGICLTVMEDYHPSAGEKWTQQADIKESSRADVIEVSVDEPVTTLYVPKVLCLLSTWPYLTAFREYLAQLYRLATATNVMTAPIERYIVNLCCEIPAPPPGAYEIQLSILDSTIRFWAPPAKLPIAYVALPYNVLFECLDLEHILELFCALLMEHKVVLVSSQYSILTICSEILCSFLFPMKWSHLYIPILPKMLCPMLDAPGNWLKQTTLTLTLEKH